MNDPAQMARIPEWSEIRERLDLNQPHPIEICDAPRLQVLIEPSTPSIGLSAPCEEVGAIPSRPARGIRIHASAANQISIWIDEKELIELGWSLLQNVATAVLAGTAVVKALEVELQRWRDLVTRLATTPVIAALGVLGELVVLRAALRCGRDASSWVGRDGGSIDFRFGVTECEVKTTLGVRHEHIITSSDQLRPSLGSRLILMSLMVAATEAGNGSSVETLVADVVSAGIERAPLEKALAERRNVHLGDPAAQALYIMRSKPFLVDATKMPAITQDVLAKALGREAVRVRDISYRLDLEGLTEARDQVLAEIASKVEL